MDRMCVYVADVRAGSLAAIFCLVYSLSHYKKHNSQTSERPLPSNHRAPVTTVCTMPSRYIAIIIIIIVVVVVFISSKL